MNYLPLLYLYSSIYNVDAILVQSIISVESQGNHNKIGSKGEIGLMQLNPQYFTNVYSIEENLKQGIRFLSYVKKRCKHKYVYKYVICYNRGLKGGAQVINPTKDLYYKKVMKEYLNE